MSMLPERTSRLRSTLFRRAGFRPQNALFANGKGPLLVHASLLLV